MKQSKILFISMLLGTLFVSQMSGNVALKSPLTIKASLDGNLAITTESKESSRSARELLVFCVNN